MFGLAADDGASAATAGAPNRTRGRKHRNMARACTGGEIGNGLRAGPRTSLRVTVSGPPDVPWWLWDRFLQADSRFSTVPGSEAIGNRPRAAIPPKIRWGLSHEPGGVLFSEHGRRTHLPACTIR